jgi:AcrR family transcriptional regulator
MTTLPQAPADARAPLSRERVLRAAVDFADADGIESLSMRRLAKELGVEAMSLYHHVANKSDLLDAIVDLVVAEIWIPSPGHEWRSAMRRRAVSAREMFTRHPWALGLVESSRSPGLDRLRYVESVLACLRSAGFSTALAGHAFSTLDSYIYGFVLQERSLTFDAPDGMVATGEDILRDLPADGFPALRETIMEFTRTGAGFADDFAFGLELILDGLERVHTEERG